MAVLFIRKPSETPNIQNIDDIRMVRYAYGNQNGYIKGYGQELSYTVVGSTFLINSGIFVVQGAEVKIDANGWSESVSGVTNKRYYTVYGEVNLALETAEIKSTYSHATYPTIEAGDDLTQSTDGTARVVLYRFTATNGIIADVVKVVKGIEYYTDAASIKTGIIADARIPSNIARTTGSYSEMTVGNATNATNALKATTKAAKDKSTNIATTEYVDRPSPTLWSSGTGAYEINTANIANYDKYEWFYILCDYTAPNGVGVGQAWAIMPRNLSSPIITNIRDSRKIRVLTSVPLLYNPAFGDVVLPLPIGYLMSGTTVTTTLTSNCPGLKIHKIIGVS